MKPTLNKADIELLKEVFVTKSEFETGLNVLWKKVESRFEKLENILAKTFQNIEDRLQALESEVGIGNTN